MAFVISAAGQNSVATFMKLKEVIKNVIDKYGIGNTKYALVTYGDAPTVHFRFKDPFARYGFSWTCFRIIACSALLCSACTW